MSDFIGPVPPAGRMLTIPIRYIARVGAVLLRRSGEWNWSHRDGTNSMADAIPDQNTVEHRGADGRWVIERYESDGQPADFFTEAFARASLLAYHFQLGIPAAPDRKAVGV
jgi:hypothetical protein